MARLHLTNLNPASVDPQELVDRQDVHEWLEAGLRAWLASPKPADAAALPGSAFCVLGEKGIGKSILTRGVIESLCEVHDADTIFLTVDCRPLRSQRGILREAGAQLVRELARPGRQTPGELLAAARSFDAFSRFDTVTRRHAHEQLIQYKAAFNLSTSASLAQWFDATLGISMLRDTKAIEKLEGSLTIDGPRVRDAFVQLLRDIVKHSSQRVILYLDNVEELAHESLHEPAERERIREEVEAILTLAEAPLGLLLNMRTYYSSVLTRRVAERWTLTSLPAREHRAIFARRLEREDPRVREAVSGDRQITAMLDELGARARTPLAFLTWVKHLLSRGSYAEAERAAGLQIWLEDHYASVHRFLDPIVALFGSRGQRVDVEDIRAACGGSDSIFRKLLDHQVLLPDDYWDPAQFYLDPQLEFLLPNA